MKIKILLFILLFTSVFLKAQSPYQNLIITEIRLDRPEWAYVELCNMGSDSVDLAQFSVGNVGPYTYAPWDTIPNHTFSNTINDYVNLPSRMLGPGETFVIAAVYDWAREMALINPERYGPMTKNDAWRLADLQLHAPEEPNRTNIPVGQYHGTDSVSVGYNAISSWYGSSCIYVCHHYTATDSAFVDAVNGIFSNEGRRPGGQSASDVAGVPNGTGNSILVRKHSVTKGNLDWEQARGVDIMDSEWLPIPTLVTGGWEVGRKEFWTYNNHGDFKLNASTFKSSSIDIDWTNLKMSVNWGVRNQDSIINAFEMAKGIAWRYQMSPSKIDSAYTSVRTGDSLTIYACGNQLDIKKFGLNLIPPTNSEARVIPKNAFGGGNWYTPFIVTEGVPGMDTIRNVAFATRVDSLFKYLEKPDAASWKIIWKDATERPDLMNGDILRVTAGDAKTTKDYFIKVEKYRPSHNANLSSITFPDLPEYYKGIFGWMGDTIPSFSPTKYNYNVQVPYDVNGIPSLIARPQDPDTKIEVVRATSLFSTEEAKTVKFYTTAEDDTTLATYSIRLEKEKDFVNVQPYEAEPFISQYVYQPGWRGLYFEICNPGNQPLDLSHYCIVRSKSLDPYSAITTNSGVNDWALRFKRYVPGYVWPDEANWQVQPSMLIKDFSVNTIIEPGDVFVMADELPYDKDVTTYIYESFKEIDVNFNNEYNPWGIEFVPNQWNDFGHLCSGWLDEDMILFKIINDSVLDGTKPLIDRNDVKVIDVLGRCNGQAPGLMIESPATNYGQNSGMIRLQQYYKGNPIPGGSFLDTLNNKPSEWFSTSESYWQEMGYGYPGGRGMLCSGIGSHELNPITEFISTVASGSYTVSKGYKNETISGGVKAGITVDEFMQSIIIADPNQSLTFSHGNTVLTGSDVLQNGDVLVVVSANKENTTTYVISVTAEGLSSNALLTSTQYTIAVNGNTGTISGFAVGTALKTVYDGCKAPSNASLYGMYKSDGSYASFIQMKYDSTYATVTATDNIFFEVIAQDGVTRIAYQLKPNSTSKDAYVLSNVYDIDQTAALIKLLVDGSNVTSFFANLIPAPGATIQLLNKLGQVRDFGTIYKDDKLVVTAADGVTKKEYSLELWSQFAARYDAFLSSDLYKINQQTLKVTGVLKGTTVDEFLNNVVFSLGATYEIKTKANAEKTATLMEDGDLVIVTSENGKAMRKYSIVLLKTSVISFVDGNIKAYPNPTTGLINIDGLQEGNVIRVFNTVGKNVLTIKAGTKREAASLENQPNGLYMVVVTDGVQQIARFKVIKK